MNVGSAVFEKSEGQPNIFTHIQTNRDDLTIAARSQRAAITNRKNDRQTNETNRQTNKQTNQRNNKT